MYPGDKVELCLSGDFNITEKNWSTMRCTCQPDDGILKILNDNLFYAQITDSTHSVGHALDNILSAEFYSVSLQRIDSSCALSDQYAILLHLKNCNWDFDSNCFSSKISLDSTAQMEAFRNRFITANFLSYPEGAVTDIYRQF